ncbi:MAG: GNAT family N-acetyltransferase [Actinobacteria bacterium]|nr:GNAT family N-acetyltransferase [Actinomycetota bacterium]
MTPAREASPPFTAERVTVRTVHHKDAGPIRDLLGELGYPQELDDVHSRLRALAGERTTKVFVAEDGADVVGVAVVHWFELLEKPGPFARLIALVVSRSYRGTGVGRRLVEAAEGVARRSGCLGIEVTTAARRREAQGFYEQMGFATGESRYYRKAFV